MAKSKIMLQPNAEAWRKQYWEKKTKQKNCACHLNKDTQNCVKVSKSILTNCRNALWNNFLSSLASTNLCKCKLPTNKKNQEIIIASFYEVIELYVYTS